jgi:hypothetical protein
MMRAVRTTGLLLILAVTVSLVFSVFLQGSLLVIAGERLKWSLKPWEVRQREKKLQVRQEPEEPGGYCGRGLNDPMISGIFGPEPMIRMKSPEFLSNWYSLPQSSTWEIICRTASAI